MSFKTMLVNTLEQSKQIIDDFYSSEGVHDSVKINLINLSRDIHIVLDFVNAAMNHDYAKVKDDLGLIAKILVDDETKIG